MDQQQIISYENSENVLLGTNAYQIKLEELFNIVSDNTNLEKTKSLKIFIKNNFEFVTNNNILDILSDIVYKDSELWRVLYSFYNLINHKINIVYKLKKWKDIYTNDIFWDLSTIDQIDFLNNLRIFFLSIYDCSQGGSVYHIKLMMIFQSNNYNYYQIMEDIEDRLKRILDLVGSKIFEHLKIPLITVRELYNLSNDQILKYITVIFKNIKQLLDEVIELFYNFNLVCSKLNILLTH